MKSGFVTLIGRPNSGKSSLVNLLIGKKVSGVSSKPQTTQTQVRGILDAPDHQIVFLDTPGIYTSEKKSHLNLAGVAKRSLEEVDLIYLVSDISRDFGGNEDTKMIELAKSADRPVFLVMIKIDLVRS